MIAVDRNSLVRKDFGTTINHGFTGVTLNIHPIRVSQLCPVHGGFYSQQVWVSSGQTLMPRDVLGGGASQSGHSYCQCEHTLRVSSS